MTGIAPLAQYAARTPDKTLLKCSSSGGVLSEFAQVVLIRGGCVVGAGWDEDYSFVSHMKIDRVSDIEKIRGSKYLSSDISPAFRIVSECIERKRVALFIGTPCQTAAIRRRFGQAPNLYLCALFCHSNVPASMWQKYLREIEFTAGSKVRAVHFRTKVHGWRNGTMQIEFEDKSKNIEEQTYNNLYMRIFFSGWATREGCFRCPFRLGRGCADVMIGDFWGIEHIENMPRDDFGMSAVLVYSPKGKEIVEHANLLRYPVSYSDVLRGNPSLEKSPTVDQMKRARFQRVFNSMDLERAVRYAEYGALPKEILMRGYMSLRRRMKWVLGLYSNDRK